MIYEYNWNISDSFQLYETKNGKHTILKRVLWDLSGPINFITEYWYKLISDSKPFTCP
jgi:hypothetical protein